MESTAEQQKIINGLPSLPILALAVVMEPKFEMQQPKEPIEESADQSAEDIEREIRQFESVNEELHEAVPVDVEMTLPEVPEQPRTAKLEALRKINQLYVDPINGELPTKPKFGSGLAEPLEVQTKQGPDVLWIDEHGTDIDSGEKLNMSSELNAIHEQKLDKRRAEEAAEFIAEYDKEKESHSHYAMTKEEFDLESEKEFPVYVLPKQPGPAWDDSILYGDAGRLVQKAAQFNESHPAGMLVDFLVSLGSIIGRGPYFTVSATRHYTNEFMARVGDSARSRKGTGRDVIDQVLKLVDPKWYSDRVESGFGSGEAVINLIRDDVIESKLNHRTGNFENKVIPGVKDKRLCIREGELASIFVLAGKPERPKQRRLASVLLFQPSKLLQVLQA